MRGLGASAALAALALFATYLRLPHEAAYLLPLPLFAVVWTASRLRARARAAWVLLLVLSHALPEGGRVRDQRRLAEEERLAQIAEAVLALPGPAVFVSGPWHWKLEVARDGARPDVWNTMWLPDAALVRQAHDAGAEVYTLPFVQDELLRRHGVDLVGAGALLLPLSD